MALVNSRLQCPNISKSYSFFFLFWLEKRGKKRGMLWTHLSLSKGWFVFSFSSLGFSFSFLEDLYKKWGLVGWFLLFLSFLFQNIEKN